MAQTETFALVLVDTVDHTALPVSYNPLHFTLPPCLSSKSSVSLISCPTLFPKFFAVFYFVIYISHPVDIEAVKNEVAMLSTQVCTSIIKFTLLKRLIIVLLSS